jgi:hypothetical protein
MAGGGHPNVDRDVLNGVAADGTVIVRWESACGDAVHRRPPDREVAVGVPACGPRPSWLLAVLDGLCRGQGIPLTLAELGGRKLDADGYKASLDRGVDLLGNRVE